jgi:hypothetical protein
LIVRKYPHLLSVDVPVWERFLALHGHQFSRFEYDVRVGNPRDPGPQFEPNIRNLAIDISRRRIDAVGFQPDRITIIEITREAGLTAIGQLIAYPLLHSQTYPDNRPRKPLLVCETCDPNIRAALAHHSIEAIILPPDATA